jgi:hypothetical protein
MCDLQHTRGKENLFSPLFFFFLSKSRHHERSSSSWAIEVKTKKSFPVITDSSITTNLTSLFSYTAWYILRAVVPHDLSLLTVYKSSSAAL